MTTDDVLASIVEKEGGYQENKADRGNANEGATNFGITSRTLGDWRRLGRPATRAEVKALTLAEAKDIYAARYARPFEKVPFEHLRAHLIDVGALSGPVTAIRLLQDVLGVPVDGILGDRTLAALNIWPWRLVNNALVGARVKLFAQIAERDDTQRQFIRGWVNRSVSFMA